MADIVIINPKFDTSFWGMEDCIGLLGKRANLPVSCLPLLASLVPDHHDVTLLDENVEEIDYGRIARADLVCLTGMNIQAERMVDILTKAKELGKMTVVGGPLATVYAHKIEGLADVIFIGEADDTWPQFLQEWEEGRHADRYEQKEKTDVTKLPTPRVDKVKASQYMFGSMQISRGCPFTCEFCDIIITFGRKPRIKTSEQIIAELESMRKAGFRIIFIVDDNFIGNKKEIKPVLRDIIAWQEANGHPLVLFTEASLDLAEDAELMELMGQAGFQSVFVGIESPNEESLLETKKVQNVRERAGTMLDRIDRIHEHGLEVWCGMILGFDNDDKSVFRAMPQFLRDARIGNALIGMLYAVPTTPLYARLKQEGRLASDEDLKAYGTNIVPMQMTQGELRDGFVDVMQTVYSADEYFSRINALYKDANFKFAVHGLDYWKKNPRAERRRWIANYARFAFVFSRLMRKVNKKELRKRYRAEILELVRKRYKEPHILFIYSIKVAMHYHFQAVCETMTKQYNETQEVIMDRAA